MKHVTVFGLPGVYAGWPANHGAWQWGDEFLVGFIIGEHSTMGLRGTHNVRGRLLKRQARSLDGGETWSVEVPNADFEGREKDLHLPPKLDLNTTIIRVCGDYDHGGEKVAPHGAYYSSSSRGEVWHGPFPFDLDNPLGEKQINTSRTCVLAPLVFLSARQKHSWGSDFTFCVRVLDGNFKFHSIVLDDDARAVMPAAALLGNRIVVALRRLKRDCWIDTVYSDDGGITWSEPSLVAGTGEDNGNPPALIEAKGKLYCAYGNRSKRAVSVSVSEDGIEWRHHSVLRSGRARDIGYPRLFKRTDGQLVCVYYWADVDDSPNDPQQIEATIFKP